MRHVNYSLQCGTRFVPPRLTSRTYSRPTRCTTTDPCYESSTLPFTSILSKIQILPMTHPSALPSGALCLQATTNTPSPSQPSSLRFFPTRLQRASAALPTNFTLNLHPSRHRTLPFSLHSSNASLRYQRCQSGNNRQLSSSPTATPCATPPASSHGLTV